MFRIAVSLALIASAAVASSATLPAGYHVIPGQVTAGKGPDGNTIIVAGTEGLLVVDTGRHPDHAQAILDYAKVQNRPIVAIANTHWHLDHTTGNREVRKTYPKARVYATRSLEGAIAGFFPNSRKNTEEFLKSGKASAATRAEIERAFYVMDHPDDLRPTDVIDRSGPQTLAGRRFDAHVSAFAASEADLWLYDPAAKVAMVGDLVVDIVPFMDTACPDGWVKALDEVAAIPFETLVPGHGPVMNRDDFQMWRTAYNNFVKCGRSNAEAKICVEGWQRDAARFIDEGHRAYAAEGAQYYLTSRLRSSPEEQAKYCKPLTAS